MDAAFYCVSSRIYFLGVVGMINSLRLVGHDEPIFLLDCGLTPAQRDLLAPQVTLVHGPTNGTPFLLKPIAPLKYPANVMVLIDADMIVTRPLTALMEKAAGGCVVAVRNEVDRHVPEWGRLLDLGETRRQPYVSSGLVFLGGRVAPEVIRLLHDSQTRAGFDLNLDIRQKRWPEHPFLFLDQDVLNAILCTRVERERTVDIDERLAPHQPYRHLRLIDEATLRCAYPDGLEPYALHQYLNKPWLEPMYHGIYSRLLARLLLGPDVAIRVPESEVPLRMRSGLLAGLERKRVDVTDLARWYARDVIPEWIGARIGTLRRGRAARGR
jgi:hypothetical protein